MSKTSRIAFYGTLRRGELGHGRLRLAQKLRFLGMCRIPGLLYDLGEYPALFTGNGTVVAELFELSSESVLSLLDEYEGYDPTNFASSLFVRRETHLASGEGMAWVYFYGKEDRPPAGVKQILSGDWGRRR